MLCQHCQKRIATVHFTQVVNNSKAEMYLCEQCANEKGQFGMGTGLNINNFFSGLMGMGHGSPYAASEPTTVICDKCEMSYEDFQKVGKLGCDKCYEMFGERLKPLIKRIHGSTEHGGKAPARISKAIKATREIEKLKELLNKAVQNEEYEKAAEIRDSIRAFES